MGAGLREDRGVLVRRLWALKKSPRVDLCETVPRGCAISSTGLREWLVSCFEEGNASDSVQLCDLLFCTRRGWVVVFSVHANSVGNYL